jgi:hypothetical protein
VPSFDPRGSQARIQKRVNVLAESNRVDRGESLPAAQQRIGRKRRPQGAQLGDGSTRPSDRYLLTSGGTIDYIPSLVPQFANADVRHEINCITRDTRFA